LIAALTDTFRSAKYIDLYSRATLADNHFAFRWSGTEGWCSESTLPKNSKGFRPELFVFASLRYYLQ